MMENCILFAFLLLDHKTKHFDHLVQQDMEARDVVREEVRLFRVPCSYCPRYGIIRFHCAAIISQIKILLRHVPHFVAGKGHSGGKGYSGGGGGGGGGGELMH